MSGPRRLPITILAGAGALIALIYANVSQRPGVVTGTSEQPTEPAGNYGEVGTVADAQAERQALRYEYEYPTIDYASTVLSGRVADFAAAVSAGAIKLPRPAPEGHLDKGALTALLRALDIDPASQTLVFSKTSLQVQNVAPETPRAIYFNDDTYIAFVQGSSSLEIASMDPLLGPVFHSLSLAADGAPQLDRQTGRCLRCHDSYSLSGGGVPRFILGSGYIGAMGEIVSHEAWILTRPATPIRSRWGGWYVTGTHGDQVHLGNIVVQDIADLQDLESLRVGNRSSLDGLVATDAYAAATSDIVALMVIQHQVQVQNVLTRTRYDLLTALSKAAPGAAAREALDQFADPEAQSLLETHVEPLVEALLSANEVQLSAPIIGNSTFTEWFEARGPMDAAGRSLRELDLANRTFRFPVSYLIYSPAFTALPEPARHYVYARLNDELSTAVGKLDLGGVSIADQQATVAILAETIPLFAAWLAENRSED
jgi:hypothetical protein